jgi:uncharacterized protein GlcG (DUF336 family)
VAGVLINLSLAARMTEAAVVRATQLGALVSAAVVDAGGHLVHFQRMDRAEIAGPTLAVDKAFTAVAHRIATYDLTALAAPNGPLAGLQANGGGRYVVFGGGLPCWSGEPPEVSGGAVSGDAVSGDAVSGGAVGGDAVVVGGIGVSGGTTEQDIACAEAALAVFTGTLCP